MLRHACVLLVTLVVAANAAARPLRSGDWLDWERAAEAQIAPDGHAIIYARRHVDKLKDRWRSELWMIDADGGHHRYLADGGGVRWSPTGDRIAYVGAADGKAAIHVRYMDAEGATSRIATGLDHPTRLAWSPDGRWIAFRARVAMKPHWTIDLPPRPAGAEWTADATVIDRWQYRLDRVGMKEWYDHIFLVPADGGTPRQLTRGEWDVGARVVGAIDIGGPLQWTPDGRHILFDGLVVEDGTEPEPFVSHLYAVDVADGTIRRITEKPGFWMRPTPSPDGRLVAYVGNAASEVNYPTPQLRVIGIDGTGDRALIAALPAEASDLHWDARGRGLYYTVNEKGATHIHHVDLKGRDRAVTRGEMRLSLDSVSRDGIAAGIVTAPQVTRNLARIALDSGTVAQLTDLNGDILHDVDLGEVEEFRTASEDGTPVQGWVITPPGFDPGRRYPMILSIHGGPHAMYGVNFHFDFQVFAARGYVVVFANPRGSTGYGPDFANAIDNRYPGRRDFSDLMAATDAVLARGFIDPERLFVTGCSGGGVLTSWTVSHTDRFAAAAALCPVIDWISFAGTTDIVAWAYRRFRPDFWQNPGLWLDHSPLMHAPEVKTPTLLMTGDLDLRTPLSQAEEFYSALRYFGVPTKLIVMKDEYHGTQSKPSNMLRTIAYLDKWFSEHDPGKTAEGGGGGDDSR